MNTCLLWSENLFVSAKASGEFLFLFLEISGHGKSSWCRPEKSPLRHYLWLSVPNEEKNCLWCVGNVYNSLIRKRKHQIGNERVRNAGVMKLCFNWKVDKSLEEQQLSVLQYCCAAAQGSLQAHPTISAVTLSQWKWDFCFWVAVTPRYYYIYIFIKGVWAERILQ